MASKALHDVFEIGRLIVKLCHKLVKIENCQREQQKESLESRSIAVQFIEWTSIRRSLDLKMHPITKLPFRGNPSDISEEPLITTIEPLFFNR
jgi:hypothetical protein